jgi:SAM-dependent methyltransferase
MNSDGRTLAQLREHYEIEKELADRLRKSSRTERQSLYSTVYDEMFRRVPLHPMLLRKQSPEMTQRTVNGQMSFIKPFLKKDCTFLEIGPGDCSLSFEIANIVRMVYAIDVSSEITRVERQPSNFSLKLTDGSSIPLPAKSVDVAYSNQLMEHLHPDDALEQLKDIYRVLNYHGVYICITPNRLSGPHDISAKFSQIAEGFHLKEYVTAELITLFKRVGFSNVKIYVVKGGRYICIPCVLVAFYEGIFSWLPHTLRRSLSKRRPFSSMQNIRIIGVK